MKMRARAGPMMSGADASAVRRWSVMLEWKDRMLVGKLRTVN
jgi:hypothetical protein